MQKGRILRSHHRDVLALTTLLVLVYSNLVYSNQRKTQMKTFARVEVEEIGKQGGREVARAHGRRPPKSLDSTKILSPNIRYFVANQDLSRFTHFLEIFGQKKCLFG